MARSRPRRGPTTSGEFLGDRVLGLTMAEALFAADRTATEGQLAPRYNALVKGETCAAIARQVGLGDVLSLAGPRCCRAAAGKRRCWPTPWRPCWLPSIWTRVSRLRARSSCGFGPTELKNVEDDSRDAKTALQEWAQAQGMQPPRYVQVARNGPDHAPEFEIAVRLDDGKQAVARGTGTKRSIEQAAARALLDQIEGSP